MARDHLSFEELRKRCTEETSIGLFPNERAKQKPFFEVRMPLARAGGTPAPGSEDNCLTGALLMHLQALWKAMGVSVDHYRAYHRMTKHVEPHRQLCLFSFFSSVSIHILGKDTPAGASVSIGPRISQNEKATVKALFVICLEGLLTAFVDSKANSKEVIELSTGRACLFENCSRAKFAAKDDKQNVLIVAKTASKEDLQDESKRCRAKWAIEICALRKEKQRYKTLKRQQIQTERGEDGNVTRVAKATSPARRDDALCVGGESYPCTHKRARLASDAYKFDMILPWQTKRIMNIQVVHRFYHPHVDPATNVERWWRDSVASFAGPVERTRFTQYIWCYEPVKARKLFCTPGFADVLILNAGILLDEDEWGDLRRKGFPIPIIKDFIQFKALLFYGGIWADLDVYWTGKSFPLDDSKHQVLLFTEYRRLTCQYLRSPSLDMWPHDKEKPRATINLGFAYSGAQVEFWQQCLDECKGYWTKGGGCCFNWEAIPPSEMRKQKHWNAHPVIVQRLAQSYGSGVVVVHEPLIAFPLFRMLSKWPPKAGDTKWGQVVHGSGDVSTQSYVVNVWTDIWGDELIGTVVSFVQDVQRKRAETKESVQEQQGSRDALRERNNRNAIARMVVRDGLVVYTNCGMDTLEVAGAIIRAQQVIQMTPAAAFAWDMDTDAGYQTYQTCLAAMLTLGLQELPHPHWPSGRMTATVEQLRNALGMRADSTEVDAFIEAVDPGAVTFVE